MSEFMDHPLSSMTATLKGDSLPNRKVFTRDSRDPAIEALQKASTRVKTRTTRNGLPTTRITTKL